MATAPHVLISGATGGLGSALALQYAQKDTHLTLLGRDKKALNELKKSCEAKGATVDCQILDMKDSAKLLDTLTKIEKKHPVTLAIANAGITSSVGKHDKLESLEQIHAVIDTNLKASINFISPIIESMQKRNSGQIALICSLAAYKGLPITPSYCASKAGLKTYGDAIRPLLKKKNVYLSVVCPGFIETKMSRQFPGAKQGMISPERAAYLIAKKLRKRKPTISFPFPLNFGTWFLSILPSRLADRIVMSSKASHRAD
jgi:short-subunit dehydrogenase